MGQGTKIAWCDDTFNPWRGCAKVSPGCANCYAEAMSARNPAVLGEWGPGRPRAVAAEPYWRLPLSWDRQALRSGSRRRVFCASLADVFEDRPDLDAHRLRLLGVIAKTPNLTWMLLTKRPERAAALLARAADGPRVPSDDHVRGCILADRWRRGGPPPNVWLGCTAENQEAADGRREHLLSVPAAVHWVSAEPLLGPIDFSAWWYDPCRHCGGSGENDHGDAGCAHCAGQGHVPRRERPAGENRASLDWVVVGGESGSKARPNEIDWTRDVLRQCRAAGVPAFHKQVGARPLDRGVPLPLTDAKGGETADWPEDVLVRQWPAAAAPPLF